MSYICKTFWNIETFSWLYMFVQRRLFNAAKKALTKIPTRTVKPTDAEMEADCPVCIDPYAVGDLVRVLPCKFVYYYSYTPIMQRPNV